VPLPSAGAHFSISHLLEKCYIRNDDIYSAECPEESIIDRGETIEQAIASLEQATRLYLEEFPLPQTPPRFIIHDYPHIASRCQGKILPSQAIRNLTISYHSGDQDIKMWIGYELIIY
jgi:predicted RNase H-like HicB family nuclease